jgi:hypothetical protein
MGWIWLFISSLILFLVIIPFRAWKHYSLAGVITMIVLYFIDSTFIKLGAFSYFYSSYLIGKLPILYLVSGFFGGIILVYYYPKSRLIQLPYILFLAFLFLCLELIMNYFDYIIYNNWTPIYSFFLNFSGFSLVIWLFYWISNTFESLNDNKNKDQKRL